MGRLKQSIQRYRVLAATYMWPRWRVLLVLSVLLLLGIGLQLVAPLVLRAFIDSVITGSGAQRRAHIFYALGFVAASLVAQLVSVAETYVAEDIAWSATNQLRADVALHCLQQDLSFHHAHPPGEMIERIDGDIGVLANFFSRFVSTVIGHSLFLAGMLGIVYSIDWRIGLPLTGFTLVAIWLLNYLRSVGQPSYTAYRQARADLMGFVEERLSGTEDIRSSGAIPYALQQLHTLLRRLYRAESVALLLSSSMVWASTALLIAAGTAIVFFLSARLFEAGVMTLGTAYLIFHYTRQLMHPLERLSEQLQDFQQAAASLARIEQLLHLEPAIRDGAGGALPSGAPSVEFHDVSFGYAPGVPTLRHVSFRLAPGGSLGILGRTGSGKTTLVRLLLRLYDPAAGIVRVGGVDVRSVRLAELRQRIALVTQDVQIFHASVRDNITVFDASVPDAAILAALRELGLWAWYQQLPRGLDTVLRAGGNSLSAGEAQLLALTRVFLLNPAVVILDEASSRLDPATEQLVDRAVQRLLRGRTSLIIAHHLATVQRVDEILILERGEVREYGRRERLAQDQESLLFRLLHTDPHEALA